jgi:hypothetical protein
MQRKRKPTICYFQLVLALTAVSWLLNAACWGI